MNIIHVSASVTESSGGIGPVIWNIASRSKDYDIKSKVVTFHEEMAAYDSYKNLELYKCKLLGPLNLGFSPQMSAALSGIEDCDVIHSHGLWLRNGYYARKEACRRDVPFVVSPHGMLEPYSLSRSWKKKRIVSILYENNNLQMASCIQAASTQEALNIKKIGIKNDVAVIPFGVEVSHIERKSPNCLDDKYPALIGKKVILFLSRIHPKKGLKNLIEAWDKLQIKFPDWRLVIVGPDEGGHKAEIEMLINEKSLKEVVIFTGQVYGREKDDWYARASLFVLPSFSENYGFVIPEALSNGCPVITTKGTPWNDLEEYKCGWWIDVGVEPLVVALEESLRMEMSELKRMGERGKKMIESKYSWINSLNKFKELYSWLVANSVKPDFIL